MAVIISHLLLSAILKLKLYTVVLGDQAAGQMLLKKPEPDLNIVLVKAMNVPKNGVAGQTGPAGELLIVVGPTKFAGPVIPNVNIAQVV